MPTLMDLPRRNMISGSIPSGRGPLQDDYVVWNVLDYVWATVLVLRWYPDSVVSCNTVILWLTASLCRCCPV
ncbi:hypothetical protein ARMSODRAFT_510774 [Armillaria solidipes]|uniref:Uncharacterized protein n=1 Tax=Armillaria solidipes TaxID=1076256 RepID=A0A2H3C1P4_9AGAR|nr:hypothetical protein ARMSODRAFT_510774 [Armillaria solidipes]